MRLKPSHYAIISLALVLVLSVFLYPRRPVHETHPRPTKRVLFIGNSYTIYNDLPWITRQLSLSAHETMPLEIDLVAMIGATLQEHWDNGLAVQKLKEDGPWDYVVLQEQSLMAIENPDELRQDARRFDTEIKKAGATTILFVPWSHREHPEQQTIITDVYLSLARELHAVIAPVGPAWQSLLTDNPQIPLYRPDQDSHPNANGSYLAACVLYAIIYRKSPEGISSEITDQGMRRHEFDPLDKQIKEEPFRLSPSDALLLQRTAWQVAKEFE